jgi:hypothetical protein
LETALGSALEVEVPASAEHSGRRFWLMLAGILVGVAVYAKVLWWLFVA